MQTVIAAATPIVRVGRRMPLRTLLFVSASVVALASAPRVQAQEECGPTAATVTCPVDAVGPNYPNGITYASDADITVNVDDAVAVDGAAGINVSTTAGNATVSAPNVTIDSAANAVEVANEGDGDATATAGGSIIAGGFGISATTAGAGNASATLESGTLSSVGAGVAASAAGAGTATATSGGDVTTSGDGAVGVFAQGVDGAASASSTGAIATQGAASHGAQAVSTAGDATVSVADVTTLGDGSLGAWAQSTDGAASVTSTGAISTSGAAAFGAQATSTTGDVSLSLADVSTLGDGAYGAFAQSEEGAASATTTGAITTEGADAHGLVVIGATDVTVDAGDISATGQGASGVIAVSTGGSTDVTVSGNVQGGWVAPAPPPEDAPAVPLATGLPFAAGVVAAAGPGGEEEEPGSVTITNNGEIGALSDTAILAYGPSIVVDNNGTVTGYVALFGDTVTFNNLSSDSFDIRNFADTDGDGVRDTEAVAISDFGGNGTFNNGPDGTVVLLNVAGATAFDTTGALLPEIGDPADYDITLEGVEQGQLTNLVTFNNAGAIIMQDMLAGGSAAVAGDTLVITGGEGGPATYWSEGGSLALDTVLNEGGALASQSDVLILDAAELGAGGATLISIENAGGLGDQTIEDGILVVDVTNPELSASGVFELDGYVIAGAYQYQLFQGGDVDAGGDPLDGNWYLRSNVSPTVDAYRAYPSASIRSARTAVGTLQQRLGNRWWRVPEQRVERTVTDPAPPPQAAPPQTREFIVFFDWDKYDLTAQAQATLREAADYAKTGAAARVVVVGHTDTSGPADYNMALSERRARAVSDAIQAQGVAAQVIGMEWFGETRPAVDTGDGVREERNRRVTIEVAVPGAVAAGPPPAPRTRTVVDVTPPSTEIQGSSVWGRIVGVNGEYERDDDLGEMDEDTFLAQAGVDFLVSENADGRMFVGVSGHYIDGDTDISNESFGDVATISQEGWGLSGNVTWYGTNGAYVDGVLSGTWFESDIDSGELGQLVSGNETFVWAASVEGGMRIPMSEGSKYYWVPQGQLLYAASDFDGFTDPFGADVGDHDADSLIGRIGVAVEYLDRSTGEDGQVNRIQGYGIASLLYEFLGQPGVSVAGLDFDEDMDDLWGEFGGGFTYSFNEQWSIYGEGLYRTALENFGDSQALQGTLGVRFNW